MAYDEELARRVAELVLDETKVTSKQMFGGLAFMLNGNMFCGINGHGLMLRVGKDQYEDILAREGAREMDFTGKALKGFVYVDETGFATEDALQDWVLLSYDFAETLPVKKAKKKK